MIGCCRTSTAAEIGGFPVGILRGMAIAILIDVSGNVSIPIDDIFVATLTQKLCFAAVGSIVVAIAPAGITGKTTSVLIRVIAGENRGFIERLTAVVEDTLAIVMLSACCRVAG